MAMILIHDTNILTGSYNSREGTGMKKIIKFFKIRPAYNPLSILLIVIILTTCGCTWSPDIKQGKFEQHMLKALLDKEIAKSAQKLFKKSYDPKNGRLMRVSEIF